MTDVLGDDGRPLLVDDIEDIDFVDVSMGDDVEVKQYFSLNSCKLPSYCLAYEYDLKSLDNVAYCNKNK